MLDTTTQTVFAGHHATADSTSMASSIATFASTLASSPSFIASATASTTPTTSSNVNQCKGSDFWCNQELTVIILFSFAIIFALISGILGIFYYFGRKNGPKKTKKKASSYPKSFTGSDDPYAMGGYSEQNLGSGAGAHGQFADPGAGYEGDFDPAGGPPPGMEGEFDDGVGYLAPEHEEPY